jgi:hypothetical protein
MAKKKMPELIRKLREGGFVFHVYPSQTEVFRGTRPLGAIVGMKEQSGRHCFRLACDSRREPRTYRGRVQAAEALQMIDDLKNLAKKHRWPVEELIVRSWDDKPRASQSLGAE